MRISGMFIAAGTALCALLWLTPAANAADLAAVIQQRYETLNSFSADFEQTLTHKESGSVERRQGSLLFQKPLLIRWQTAKPHEETLVVTAKEIWIICRMKKWPTAIRPALCGIRAASFR